MPFPLTAVFRFVVQKLRQESACVIICSKSSCMNIVIFGQPSEPETTVTMHTRISLLKLIMIAKGINKHGLYSPIIITSCLVKTIWSQKKALFKSFAMVCIVSMFIYVYIWLGLKNFIMQTKLYQNYFTLLLEA